MGLSIFTAFFFWHGYCKQGALLASYHWNGLCIWQLVLDERYYGCSFDRNAPTCIRGCIATLVEGLFVHDGRYRRDGRIHKMYSIVAVCCLADAMNQISCLNCDLVFSFISAGLPDLV